MTELQNVLQMIQVSDSLFPIGAYTLSNGLETFVLEEHLQTSEDLEKYVNRYLDILPYNDLGVMVLAFRNAKNNDYICELDCYSMALKAPMEVRTGSQKLCRRFMKIWKSLEEYQTLRRYQEMIKTPDVMGNHAIAVGLYASDIHLAMETAAAIYAYGLVNAVITNAVKTVPLSQIAGQDILRCALKRIPDCVKRCENITMDDLGIGGTEFDICAMNHEYLYSRLYMS